MHGLFDGAEYLRIYGNNTVNPSHITPTLQYLFIIIVILTILISNLMKYNKENLERHKINKNGRGERAALT